MNLRSSLLCASLVLLGCESSPQPESTPPALEHALGARPERNAPLRAGDTRRLMNYDVAPFVEAGFSDAAYRLRDLIGSVLRARASTTDEAGPTVWVDPSGHVLSVHAEPRALAAAEELLDRLRAEKTQRILLDVHLVDVPSERLAFLDGEAPSPVPPAFLDRLADDLRKGQATTLTRRQLRLTPGRRESVRETRSRRPVVRITVNGGLPTAEQETVEDGLVLHATCWLGANDSALTHFEFALQVEAPEAPRTLAVGYHRPADGSKGPSEAVVDASIDLPRLNLAGLRGQLQVSRGEWNVAAAGPGLERGRRVVALVRARWNQRVSPMASITIPGGAVLQSLRIALPQRTAELAEEAATRKSAFFGSALSSEANRTVLGGLDSEYARQQAVSVRNDIGFGRQILTRNSSSFLATPAGSGIATRSPLEVGTDRGWTPLLPKALVAQRSQFEVIAWGVGSQLEFTWDQLHVLHDRITVRKLESLIQAVEAWRNQPLRVRAEWIDLDPAELEAVSTPEGLAAALPAFRKRRVLEAYHLVTRSGAWTELSLSQSEAVLWGFFGPDRASPETRVVSHGSRCGVRPRLYGDGRLELALRFGHQQSNSQTLKATARAEGWVHQPRFHESSLEQTLVVESGVPQLLIAESTAAGRRLRGLLVTCWRE